MDWSRIESLIFAADCGPHFRSKENVAHYCCTLPKLLNVPVKVCWLGEQHGKSGVDRAFGWCNGWVSDYIQRHFIHGIDDLLSAFRQGANRMMREDPQGPVLVVSKFEPGVNRPSARTFFECAGFKISRTYALSGQPSRHTESGVSIRNHHFSDMTDGGDLLECSIREVISNEVVPWRRAYYDKPKGWELEGPEAGDKNAITKRFAEQRTFVTANLPPPRRTFLENCSAKALSLSRAARKKRRKHEALRPQQSESSSNASSSNSDSSSSAA